MHESTARDVINGVTSIGNNLLGIYGRYLNQQRMQRQMQGMNNMRVRPIPRGEGEPLFESYVVV